MFQAGCGSWHFFLCVFLLSLAACTPFSRSEATLSLARSHALVVHFEKSGGFNLLTLLRFPNVPSRHLVVYVEGDGFAWQSRHRLSNNPTPKNPLALKLMLQDSVRAAVYLARPCQYFPKETIPCPSKYWSSHRYAPEVIAAMGGVINTIKKRMDVEKIGLVGYSGGGVIAALLAAKRADVLWLITVAANLDVTAWTRHHRVTPMPKALNPVHFAQQLAKIPQFHFVGAKDKQVPLAVTHAYTKQLPFPKELTVRVLPTFDHSCCWEKQWPKLLASIPFINNSIRDGH